MPLPLVILSAFTGALIAIGVMAQRRGAESRPDFMDAPGARGV
ncbi:MAG: hypothetical protein QM692_24120 [Thermomicrobiales bacterium]